MSGEAKVAESGVQAPQCQFFVQRKKRLCRMTVKPGRQYCGEHEPQPKGGAGEVDRRVPCPNDPKHTCYASKLEKHLKICNARRTAQPAYIVDNINAPEPIEDCPRRPLSTIPKDVVLKLIDKVNHLYSKYLEDHIKSEPPHPIHHAVLPEFSEADRTESSLRHLRQTSALLWIAEQEGLVRDGTCYVELGAGKGQLSYYACHAWCGARAGRVLAVDRAPLRHKRDNKLRSAPPQANRHTDRLNITEDKDQQVIIDAANPEQDEPKIKNKASPIEDSGMKDRQVIIDGVNQTDLKESESNMDTDESTVDSQSTALKNKFGEISPVLKMEDFKMSDEKTVDSDNPLKTKDKMSISESKVSSNDDTSRDITVAESNGHAEFKNVESIGDSNIITNSKSNEKLNNNVTDSIAKATEDPKLESHQGKTRERGDKEMDRDENDEVSSRLRADLAHLALEAVPAVAASTGVVGIAKHLCGVATDSERNSRSTDAQNCLLLSSAICIIVLSNCLGRIWENKVPKTGESTKSRIKDFALRCVAAPGVLEKTHGVVLATCCHHRCERAAYVGVSQLQELGINAEEFNTMLGIVSWATCGDGRSRRRPAAPRPADTPPLCPSREERELVGRKAKAILDWGRVLWLRERGFEARLCYYVPREVSLENVCLVARKR